MQLKMIFLEFFWNVCLSRSVWWCVAVLAAGSGAANPNLKHFSVWDAPDACGISGKTTPQPDCVKSCLGERLSCCMGSSLLRVTDTFFCKGVGLCPDYKEKWATLYTSWVKPMLQEGSLFGIFFGDELGWQCVSWANLTEAIDTVRADIPRGDGILYYNEGYPVFTDNVCDPGGDFKPAQRTNFSYPSVPDGLDWISVDYYPDEGTLAGVPKLYEQHIYPKMAAHQKALFVPPAYSCNTTACSNRLCCSNNTRDGPNVPCNGDCTAAMLQWAKGSYDWARNDSRIVGLNPWHYTTEGVGLFEPGMSGMPQVFAAYKAIGAEIVSGRQADIDFARFGLE